jgi:hypothetical protein
LSPNDPTVKKDKADQLDKVFKHLKQPGGAQSLKANPSGAVPGLDPELVNVLSQLDVNELQALSDVNEKLLNAGFGVSGGFRVSMV